MVKAWGETEDDYSYPCDKEAEANEKLQMKTKGKIRQDM